MSPEPLQRRSLEIQRIGPAYDRFREILADPERILPAQLIMSANGDRDQVTIPGFSRIAHNTTIWISGTVGILADTLAEIHQGQAFYSIHMDDKEANISLLNRVTKVVSGCVHTGYTNLSSAFSKIYELSSNPEIDSRSVTVVSDLDLGTQSNYLASTGETLIMSGIYFLSEATRAFQVSRALKADGMAPAEIQAYLKASHASAHQELMRQLME